MWRAKESGPVGLLAGSGDLPFLFARAARALKREFILVGLEGHTDKRLGEYASAAHYLELGTLDRLPGILKSAGVKRVVDVRLNNNSQLTPQGMRPPHQSCG